MLDPKLLRDDFENVVKQLATRGLPENINSWKELDQKRREIQFEYDEIRAKKNKLSPAIAQAKKSGANVDELVAELKLSTEREKELGTELPKVEEQLLNIELLIPNIPHASAPVGKSEEQNKVEKVWGEKPKFSFTPKPHWDVAEALGIVDFERAAKLSGARFAIYRGDGARLERALTSFMLDRHRESGYMEIMPPLLVREETMRASGQLPKFYHEAFKTSEFEPQLFLIPTSEVALVNLHADEVLEADQLPLYYTAFTPCFRAEAGSHGRDVRGLIRQHQFNKVELVKIITPETSYEELEKLVLNAEGILEALGLPYRRVLLCTGDTGMASAKTFDLEVWLPGMDAYREISSCSNTTDFQSRRTKTRYRPSAGDKPHFVHMLNGSGLAIGRTLVAILENFQQANGTVIIPEVLRPYLGGQTAIGK